MFEKLLILLMAGAVTLSRFIPSPSQMINLFESGQKLFVIEDYSQAIEKYEKILAIDSPFLAEEKVVTNLAEMELSIPIAARYQMANCYKNLDKYDKAVENFKIVAKDAKDEKLRAMAQYQIILSRYNQEHYEETIQEAKYLLQNYTESDYEERALYNIGWSYYKLEKYDESISAFKQKIEKFPEGSYSPRSQFQIGECYFKLEKYQQAIDSFYELTEKYMPESFSERQWSEMELSRLKRRMQVQSSAAKGREEEHVIELSAKAYIRIGDAYDLLNEPEKAIETYKRIPQDYLPMADLVETAYIKTADVTMRSKGFDDAIQVYKNAIDLSSDRVFQGKMQFQIAKLSFQHQHFEQAVREYKLYIAGYREVSQAIEFTVDEAYYQLALSFFEDNQYDSSLVYYQVVLDSFPDSHLYASAFYGKGLTYQKLVQFDQALAVMNDMTQKFPEDEQTPLAYLQIARIYFDRKEYDLSIQAFQSLLENFQDNENVNKNTIYFELGLCYRDRGQTDLAIDSFRKIDKASDYFPGAYSEISEIYLKQGDFAQAEKVLLEVLEVIQEPERKAEIHYYLARLYVTAEDYNKAAEQFTIAIQDLKKTEIYQSALFGRGAIYLQSGQFNSAVDDFENLLGQPHVIPELKSKSLRRLVTCYLKIGEGQKAIDAAQNFIASAKNNAERADGLLALAQAYYEMGNFQPGILVADQILSSSENEDILTQAYFLKGNCFLGLKDYNQAVIVYQTAIQKHPNSAFIPDVLFQLGIAYYNSEDYEMAASTFDRVVKRVHSGENRLYSLYYRGYCLFRIGEWEEARRSFSQIVTEFPHREEATEAAFQIAECYFNERDYEKAIKAYINVQKKYPKSRYAALAMYNSGWGYIQNDQQEQGIQIFQELIKTYPDSLYAVDALFTLGDWHYNNKRYDDAEKAYQQLIERYPNTELAEKARVHIHELSQITSYLEYEKASALFDEKNYSEAIEAFQKVIEKYPGADVVVGAQVNIAAAYEQLKEWRKALKLYEEIIQMYKDTPEHQDAYAFAKEHYEWIKENY